MLEKFSSEDAALLNLKLSLENNAMLQQTILLQEEILKTLAGITEATCGRLSDGLRTTMEEIYESHRKRRIDAHGKNLALLEDMKLTRLILWLCECDPGKMEKGSENDYQSMVRFGS